MARPSKWPVQWDAVAVTALILFGATVYVVWRFTAPADCAWLAPDSGSWRAAGVVPHASATCPVGAGELVLAATSGDGLVEYQLAGGRSVTVEQNVRPEAPLERLRDGIPTMLFTLPQFLLCLAMMIRQPTDRAAGAALVYSSGLFGSTLITTLGLPLAYAFEGVPRLVFLATTQVTFSLLWAAALLFGALFPTPMTDSVERWPQRAVIAGGPPLLFLIAAAVLWLVTGGEFHPWVHLSIQAQTTITVLTLLGIMVLLVARMVRFRADDKDPVARQQLLWVGGTGMAALALTISLTFVPQLLTESTILHFDQIGLPGLLFVVGLGIGLARYRMFDLEWLLVKILVYTALFLMALGVYAIVAPVLEGELPGFSPVTAGVTAAVVAALVAPYLHDRVERAVNWIVYRDADDRYRTLSRVASRLSGRTVDFPRVAADIRRALRIPRLEIRAPGADTAIGTTDLVPGSAPLAFPLRYGAQDLGTLVAYTRGRGDRFSEEERHLLRDLAQQVAVALHQAELAVELQRSRERLVLAREEERLALRRVLHDDIAPTVAGIGLQAETVRQMLAGPHGDGAAASGVLESIGRDSRSASQQLRALAYDLRPPALDYRGLVGALTDQAARVHPLRVQVDAVGLGEADHRLPAAVEVAAFRIVTGALANVYQHAQASHCRVVLRREEGRLHCEVSDDGVGLPQDLRPGVGLASMRERAAELGGTLVIGPRTGGGTVVQVEFPLEVGSD